MRSSDTPRNSPGLPAAETILQDLRYAVRGLRAKPGFRMLCGGEALPRELADRLSEGAGTLWNMYGPTETTVWSTCWKVQQPEHGQDQPIKTFQS